VRLPAFTLQRPETVDGAVALLADRNGEAAVYMGGTELLVLMKLGFTAYSELIDCKRIVELQELAVDDHEIRIGAAVTHARIAGDSAIREALPALAALEAEIANVRVRNVGTLGGNLCFAEPHSDPAPLLIALGASVETADSGGRRRTSLEDFIEGPLQTTLTGSELLTRIVIPRPSPRARVAVQRIAFRERPVANVALVMDGDDVRIAVGAVGPRPVRAPAAEQLLAAGGASALAAAGAALAEAARPEPDLDGSADYKAHLVSTLLERTYRTANRKGVGE
jgi:carbon-monoxide dehydrogenase medium subunit